MAVPKKATDSWGVEREEWLSSRDERVRDTHADADGQIVVVGQPFEVGDAHFLFPGDTDGLPEKIINCRCTTIPVVS